MNNNYLKSFILLLSIIFSYQLANAQTGAIKGKVTTSDGQAGSLVSITIKGIKGTVVDDKGQYLLKGLKPGNYEVTASYIGLASQSKQAFVIANQVVELDFILSESGQQLKEVTIKQIKANKFAKKESPYVARLPLLNMENPQVYSTISSELIKEQVITSFDDIVKNAPGIDKLWTSTGRSGDGAAYYSLRGFAVQPNLLNGLPGLTNGGLDVSNVERLEVIKGPSGTLFGSSLISYGGLINVVTKRPYEQFGGEINYTSGTYGLNRFSADINTPLKENLFLRINTAYHTEGSFQDAGFRKALSFAPSLSYKASDRLSIDLNAEFLNEEKTNPAMIFLDRGAPLLAKNMDELGYNPKLSFTNNELTLKNPISSFQGQINYKLSDSWTSQTVYSRSAAKSDGYYSYLYEVSRFIPNYPNIDGVFRRYVSKQNGNTYTSDIQQNFIGDFKIGKFRNRLVAGLDYYNKVIINNSSGYAVVGDVKMNGEDTGILTRPAVDDKLRTLAAPKTKTSQEVYSAYVSNVFNFTPQLSAMLSGRLDYFDNKGLETNPNDDYDQTAFSPKLGIVYQPIKDKISIFGNYMNGFRNIAPITQGSVVNTFRPEQANQIEGGVKLSLFNNLFTGTLSYYDIRVSDVVRQGGETAPGSGVFQYSQDGENYSKGFEAEVIANPFKGLNIIAGYSHNDSKVVESSDLQFVGRRPESAGPQDMVNLWLSYKFLEGNLNGFGLGFGGNYASENFIMNRLTPGAFALPAYTVLNASASYQTNRIGLILKLDNLTNKEYYKGWSTIEAQRPRTVNASLSYKF